MVLQIHSTPKGETSRHTEPKKASDIPLAKVCANNRSFISMAVESRVSSQKQVNTIDLTSQVSPPKSARAARRTVIVMSPTVSTGSLEYIDPVAPSEGNRVIKPTKVAQPAPSHTSERSSHVKPERLDAAIDVLNRPSDSIVEVDHRKASRSSAPKNMIGQEKTRKMVRHSEDHKVQAPGIDDLAVILEEIQQVLFLLPSRCYHGSFILSFKAILRKVTGRIEGVRRNVRAGRDTLLSEAAADLSEMQVERFVPSTFYSGNGRSSLHSIEHYNTLIDLEAEYATFGRNIIHGFDDLVRADQSIRDEAKKIIETHDRSTLSKEMPATLFSSSLPASILKFKV